MKSLLKNKAGSALVEFGLLVAGVALVGAAATSMFGHKTTDLVATVAAVLPCAHADDAGPIVSAKLIETTRVDPTDPSSPLILDLNAAAAGGARLGNNLISAFTNGAGPEGNLLGELVVEAGEVGS